MTRAVVEGGAGLCMRAEGKDHLLENEMDLDGWGGVAMS